MINLNFYVTALLFVIYHSSFEFLQGINSKSVNLSIRIWNMKIVNDVSS